MLKFFRDITSDEYGKDTDLTSAASVIGFAVGMTLYVLSQFFPALLPNYSLGNYAIGFAALIGSIVTCQRLKPPAVVKEVDSPTKDPQ